MNRELPGGLVCLPTQEPLICAPEEKAAIETANCVQQLAYIEYLVETQGIDDIRESHLLELQSLAIAGLYPCGGTYRNWTRSAKLEGGGATHVPPEPALIPSLVREMLDTINDRSSGEHVIVRAAYAPLAPELDSPVCRR